MIQYNGVGHGKKPEIKGFQAKLHTAVFSFSLKTAVESTACKCIEWEFAYPINDLREGFVKRFKSLIGWCIQHKMRRQLIFHSLIFLLFQFVSPCSSRYNRSARACWMMRYFSASRKSCSYAAMSSMYACCAVDSKMPGKMLRSYT
ncbi:hypothetical protein C804_05195 [Lachnospiraceae bacterium A4]|nr:hypothetical protein C804_05195 [Lachnospiraceae bacterium A4]